MAAFDIEAADELSAALQAAGVDELVALHVSEAFLIRGLLEPLLVTSELTRGTLPAVLRLLAQIYEGRGMH